MRSYIKIMKNVRRYIRNVEKGIKNKKHRKSVRVGTYEEYKNCMKDVRKCKKMVGKHKKKKKE